MKVEPRILSGMMELMPQDQIEFNEIKDVIREVYESFGFMPLDTPVIEIANVLLAKAGGETEKQIYRFTKGDNDLALRFDLTVPLARFVGSNYHNLVFPFKRYQIGKVYRGERPQKGRFREFYQCDIDIIGNDVLPLIYDAEIPSVIYNIFKRLDFGKFTIRMNNRKILNGFFASLGSDNPSDILRIIDKIDKIGEAEVSKELTSLGLSTDKVSKILEFVKIKGSFIEVIDALKSLNVDNEVFKLGILEMEELSKNLEMFSIPSEYYVFDLTIARGLDYYTGVVYETKLDDYPELGSVCSGGKYENLTGFYTDESMPGIGISIGLTRLYSKLKEMNLIKSSKSSLVDILVMPFSSEYNVNAIEVARSLRNSGLVIDTYLLDKNLKNKFKYADRLGIKYVIIIGESEASNDVVTLKDMVSGEQSTLKLNEVLEKIKEK